jgi:hypothetical protein
MNLRAPSGEHEAKKLLQSKDQIRTTVFWRLEIPMSLRAPSRKCEAKNRCRVGSKYEQRFFGVLSSN